MENAVYNRAKNIALNNGHQFHLAAVLYRKNKVIKIGTNVKKTHPKFVRTYEDGSVQGHLHAEMDVLRYSKPGDKITVLRFSPRGDLTMAKPCRFCQKFIREYGISEVTYTNWDGKFVKMRLE